MTLQFGKHKSKELKEVPLSYLIWLHENYENHNPEIAMAVEKELEKRYDEGDLDAALEKIDLKSYVK